MRYARRLSIAAVVFAWAGAVATPTAAQLAPTGPLVLYLGGEGGWTQLSGEKDRVPGKSFPETWRDGFNAGARVGAEWGPWRVEEEFRYQDNDVSTFARHSVRGGRQGYALLTNAIYDIPLGWKLSPHIGAGIGVIDIVDRVTAPILGLGVVTSGSDWQFAYQAIAGLHYELHPALAIDLDYRFLGTSTPHFRTPPGLIVDGAPAGNLTVATGYTAHSLVASLSLRFGAPRSIAGVLEPRTHRTETISP